MTSKDTRPAPRAVSPSSARDDSARVGAPDVSQRPSCGLRVAFRALSYSVATAKGRALILDSVSGVFQPGQVTALMGPSGSGKTTLLDVLAGRAAAGERAGDVAYGGRAASPSFLRRFTAYTEQFDTLIAELTVEQMLTYTAELKRPWTEPPGERVSVINGLVEALGLESCRHVRIGSKAARGISGGQAKRVNIGLALVATPRVLFLARRGYVPCDEPTTGLDSFTANEVMRVVAKLAASSGATVCATVHSPTAEAFSLFDSLLLLSRGRAVLCGPTQAALGAARVLWYDLPAGRNMDTGTNGSEWVIDVVTRADRDGRSAELAARYAASPAAAAVLRDATAEVGAASFASSASPNSSSSSLVEPSGGGGDGKEAALSFAPPPANPGWWALRTLLKHRLPADYRSASYVGARVGDKIVMGLLVLSLFWGIGRNFDTSNLYNQGACLAMWVILPAFGASTYIPALVLERPLYNREHADGLFTPLTYLVFKIFEEVLLATAVSVGASAAVFYAVGFQGSFGVFWAVYLFILWCSIALAYLVAAVSPSLDVANMLLPTYATFGIFFAGFILEFATMPVWWRWYSYINFLRFGWSALMINQARNRQYEANDPQFLAGKTVLEHYNLKNYETGFYGWYRSEVDKNQNLGFLLLFFFCYCTLTWLAVRSIKRGGR